MFKLQEGDEGCRMWTEATVKKIREYEKTLPYLCINCKRHFKDIPKKKPNECKSGYYHDIIRTKDLIERNGVQKK